MDLVIILKVLIIIIQEKKGYLFIYLLYFNKIFTNYLITNFFCIKILKFL